MNRWRMPLLGLLALALTFLLTHDLRGAQPQLSSLNHSLKRTHFFTETSILLVHAYTWTSLLGPVTISCPGSSGTCAIEVNTWVQTDDDANNDPAHFFCLVPKLDGSEVYPGCVNIGRFPGYFTNVSNVHYMAGVGAGNHNLQLWFHGSSTNDPIGAIATRTTVVRVYKP